MNTSSDTTREPGVQAIGTAVGSDIGTRTWPAGFAAWNRYAAVNDEFYDVHMDHEAARAAGMPGAFGMGNLQVAHFNVLLEDWLSGQGRVTRLSVTFRSPSLTGTVTAGGTVVAMESSSAGTTVTVDVWSRDDAGRDLCTGTATVVFDDA